MPLVVSRQLLQSFAQELGRLEAETQKEIALFTLTQIQPRVVSFEEQVLIFRILHLSIGFYLETMYIVVSSAVRCVGVNFFNKLLFVSFTPILCLRLNAASSRRLPKKSASVIKIASVSASTKRTTTVFIDTDADADALMPKTAATKRT